MAQLVLSWFICDGRFRVHAINAVGRRSARIIEIEDVDTGERFHGSARRLQRLFQSLGSSGWRCSRRQDGRSRREIHSPGVGRQHEVDTFAASRDEY